MTVRYDLIVSGKGNEAADQARACTTLPGA